MANFWQFLHVGDDGEIWWRLEDAFKLAAGFVPSGEDLENPGALLRPVSDRAAADAAALAEVFHGEASDAVSAFTAVHDGRCFAKADGFLEWASRHQSRGHGSFEQPSSLLHQVLFAKLGWHAARSRREARARKVAAVPPFESLTAALSDLFHRRFLELPEAVRERVRSLIGPGIWDAMSADERRDKTLHWDYDHDPATEQDRLRAEGVPLEIVAVDREIHELEALIPQTITEKKIKDDDLKVLRERVQRLCVEAGQIRRAREAYLAGTIGLLRPVPPRTETSDRKTRYDDLAIELNDLLNEMVAAGEPLVSAAVMARLQARAGERGSCIAARAPDGVVWIRTSSGMKEKLFLRALEARIDRWKERRSTSCVEQ